MRLILFFGVLAMLAAAGCGNHETTAAESSAAATNYEARGVVIRLEPDGHTLVIRHDDIPNYMRSMTMPFPVSDAKSLLGVQPGNRIAFRLTVTGKNAWIDNLRILETNAPAPERPTARVVRDVNRLSEGEVLPEYHFTNELGKAVNFQDYRGSVVAFTFFFTSCPYPLFCPKMCANFQETTELLAHEADAPKKWHLFAISFDPETDSPPVLESYAKRYHYDPAQWSFLTGALIDITAIGEQFGLDFWRESGSITHNLRTVVIDPQGRVFKILPSNEWTSRTLADIMKQAAVSRTK